VLPTTPGSNWKSNFFFFGHLAKGTIYILIGGLAIAAVVAGSSDPAGYRSAMRWLQEKPGGTFLLVLLAAGMFSYCAWRWTKAVLDVTNEGNDADGIVKRIAFASSGTFYGALGAGAVAMALGSSSGSGTRQSLVVTVLEQGWGPALFVVGAIVALLVGLAQLRRGIQDEFLERLTFAGWSASAREAAKNFGRAGHVARAIVYGVIAYFLLQVAITEDPSRFRGVGGALEYLAQGAGAYLLVVVSLGLLLYGAFMYVVATHRKPIVDA